MEPEKSPCGGLFVIYFNSLAAKIVTNAAHHHNHNSLFFNGKIDLYHDKVVVIIESFYRTQKTAQSVRERYLGNLELVKTVKL
jgi:hypothetical protein